MIHLILVNEVIKEIYLSENLADKRVKELQEIAKLLIEDTKNLPKIEKNSFEVKDFYNYIIRRRDAK